VAMTAHATLEERQRCLDVGMNDHVSKPIDPALLFTTMRRFYTQRPAAPSRSSSDGEQISAGLVSGSNDALPAHEDLDARDGRGRVERNWNLYRNVRRQFVDQQGAASAQITEALARNEVAVAERLAHPVKGVCGNLGVPAVQQAAANLEKKIATKTAP